jgi:glycosyltransferase involved in cell wall biosynthesis
MVESRGSPPSRANDPVFLVTDQVPDTGIGTYADALFRLLGGEFPGLQVLYLGSRPINERPGWVRLPGTRAANQSYRSPPLLRVNYQRMRASLPADAAVHFCGASYYEVPRYSKSVVTLHDYYPRQVDPRGLGRPINLLRDGSSLWDYIVIPHQVAQARVLVVPTHYVQKCLAERAGLTARVIPHWLDPTRFHYREKGAARKTLGLPTDKRLVLNVSLGTSNKNYGGMSRLAASLPHDSVLVKVGGKLPSSAHVIQMPRLDDEQYPLVFNACDVYLHMSVEEGFGRPLIEAMASGLPIVARRTDVSEEVLGRAAVFVDGGDDAVRPWMAAIDTLLEEDVRRQTTSEANSRLPLFSPEAAREAYAEVYREAFVG